MNTLTEWEVEEVNERVTACFPRLVAFGDDDEALDDEEIRSASAIAVSIVAIGHTIIWQHRAAGLRGLRTSVGLFPLSPTLTVAHESTPFARAWLVRGMEEATHLANGPTEAIPAPDTRMINPLPSRYDREGDAA